MWRLKTKKILKKTQLRRLKNEGKGFVFGDRADRPK